ncbi:hypothetical protein D3C84_854430 [compost metagenome]
MAASWPQRSCTSADMAARVSVAEATAPLPCSTSRVPLPTVSAVCRVCCCMLAMVWLISAVDWLVRLASWRTSSATTANPRPCSPARAASMAALSASRLVCSAMVAITSVTRPTCSLWLLSSVIA